MTGQQSYYRPILAARPFNKSYGSEIEKLI